MKQTTRKDKKTVQTRKTRSTKKAVRSTKKKQDWRIRIERWLSLADYIFIKAAVSILLIHDLSAYISTKFM
ncbi:MAG: hypothetical protein WA584_02095 [Pyrinomonadaceae bacterium]